MATSSLSAALLGQQSPTNDLETPEALRDYIGSGEAPAAAGFLGRRVSTPLARRQSDLQREQVWERLYEEFREHFRIRIWIICIVIGAWLVSFAYVFAWNIYALVCHSAEPCDQPLKYYLVTVFAFGQTMQPLQRFCAHGCCFFVWTLSFGCQGHQNLRRDARLHSHHMGIAYDAFLQDMPADESRTLLRNKILHLSADFVDDNHLHCRVRGTGHRRRADKLDKGYQQGGLSESCGKLAKGSMRLSRTC